MPEHTSFFSYLIHLFPALGENIRNMGSTLRGQALSEHHLEPLFASLAATLMILVLAFVLRKKIENTSESIVPDESLSLRTFFEMVIGMFYDMMKDIMGPERAKRYFPIIGTSGLFILFSNYMGMIPGILPPTSSLRVTFGCALVIFIVFNYYGLKANGVHYISHLFGPWMGYGGLPINLLIFVVELVSFSVRPVTLAVRLFLNLSVDHLLLSIFTGLFLFLIPIPIMFLGALVCIVQVVVFCLLSSIYIGLATEPAEHEQGHRHRHGLPGHH